jgi:predicted small lipoprotein YifL
MNMNKVINAFIGVAMLFALSIPFIWMGATVTACGWKGLFVECRIVECQK